MFFGTPQFAVPSLHVLLSAGHEIAAVVTQPDREVGRGRKIRASDVKSEAQEKGLRVLQPQRVRDTEFIQELKDINPSVVVVVAYGQILPPAILRLPHHGCINVHASLLPAYRGAAPVNWALLNGEKMTGITIMLMDEGMDTGPVLLQEETEIRDDDTAGTLSHRLSEAGGQLLVHAVGKIEKGTLIPKPQAGKVSYAPPLQKSDARIQWSRSARELCYFIRGMNPWPGAYSHLDGKRVKILKGLTVDMEDTPENRMGEPGVIDTATRDQLIVTTGAGKISILELQPSGKPAMTVKSFLQGRIVKKGMRFLDS